MTAGDDEPGWPGVVGGQDGVRLRLAGLLTAQLEGAGEDAVEGAAVAFGDADCQGIGHGGESVGLMGWGKWGPGSDLIDSRHSLAVFSNAQCPYLLPSIAPLPHLHSEAGPAV